MNIGTRYFFEPRIHVTKGKFWYQVVNVRGRYDNIIFDSRWRTDNPDFAECYNDKIFYDYVECLIAANSICKQLSENGGIRYKLKGIN